MAEELAAGLNDKHDVTVITCRIDKTFSVSEKKDGYTIIRVGNGVGLRSKLLYPLLALIEIRRIQPDIVHAIMESYAAGALWLARFFYPRAKRILTLQSGDLDDAKKQKQFLIRLFWRQIHKAPDILTAISRYLAARPKRLGIDKDVAITPNGVDFSALPTGVDRIPARVICVGRLSWEKGHEYLLQAWPRIHHEFPQAKLVLVGEGAERPNIEKLIAELKIGDSVELLGNRVHSDALAEIACSEIFVCPSLAEGLGIVFIEAQALGVPVIGTAVGGIPDVIEDGVNGLLVAPKDPEAIALAVRELLFDQVLSARLAANARETVKKFEWRNIIRQFDAIYRRTLT